MHCTILIQLLGNNNFTQGNMKTLLYLHFSKKKIKLQKPILYFMLQIDVY